MRKLDEHGWIWIVFVLLMLIILVFAYYYLSENWEDIFGPEAEKFYEFDVISQEEEFISNKTHYKVNFKLTALKDMYYVEISPKNSSGITKITSLNGELPTKRTIQAGTTIYPTMTVQLDNDTLCGQVEMQISFLDIDAHEKISSKSVTVMVEDEEASGTGFEFVLAMAGISLVAYFLRRRDKL